MNNPKDFLPYYIGTGAEVEITFMYAEEEKLWIREITPESYETIMELDILSIRFTNLISIDELTDEQRLSLPQSYISGITKEFTPEMFHELLQMRVDLFGLTLK